MPTATVNTTIEGPPAPSQNQINNCIFSSWYENYKSHVPKTRVIKPLPKEFIDYLLADGLHLPDEGAVQWDDASDNGDWDDDENEAEPVEDPTVFFKNLHNQINSTIDELGGKVTPKLNWSAPRDGTWISTTSDMKCVSATDIYMLLKASQYITHDLTEAYDLCHDKSEEQKDQGFELVLRKWLDINKSVEFRCFVKDRQLVGVTQRDMNYYDFLEPLKPRLANTIKEFFDNTLKTSFLDSSFVFDVYIPRPFEKVWLIDINPWATKTDTHLFSWEQLANMNTTENNIDFRLVDKEDSSRGFGSTEHTESTVPKDFVDASVTGSGIAEIARQLKGHLNMQTQDSDSDSE